MTRNLAFLPLKRIGTVYYYYEDGMTKYIDPDRLVAVDRWKGKDIGWAGYFEAFLQEVFSSFDGFLPSFFLSRSIFN